MVIKTSFGVECSTLKEAIIRELLHDSTISYKDLAKRYGASMNTIYATVWEAKKLGLLKGGRWVRKNSLKKLKEEIESGET